MTAKSDSQNIEQWGLFELTLPGPSDGNPFVEVELSAEFRHQHRGVTVDGFYDGAGMYQIRFMPDTLGHWTYTTHSNRSELHDARGAFACTAPAPGNHGPVVVKNRLHFSYADDHPYVPVGTTTTYGATKGRRWRRRRWRHCALPPLTKCACVCSQKTICLTRTNRNTTPLKVSL